MVGNLLRTAAIWLSVLPLGILGPSGVGPVGSAASAASSIAPSTTATAVPSDFGLTVSPSRLVIGQHDANQQSIRLINTGVVSKVVTAQKRNFTTGVDGALKFQQDAAYSAADWITVTPARVEIAPGATQVVIATVDVPKDPEPGDHQVALVFASADDGAGNITINRGIGIPVYLTVPGPVDDSASISSLAAPGFSGSGPVVLTATVRNTGTVHRDFRGDKALTVDAGGDVIQFPDFTVPRDSERIISGTWDAPVIGIFHPAVEFVNADGSVQTATVRVIVFPAVPVAIGLVALLLVAALILLIRRGFRASVSKALATQLTAGNVDE